MTAVWWVALIAAAYFAVSLVAAGVIGRGIRVADERHLDRVARQHHAALMGHDLPLEERRERVLRLIQGGAR